MKFNKTLLKEITDLDSCCEVVSNTAELYYRLKKILKHIENSDNWMFYQDFMDKTLHLKHKVFTNIDVASTTIFGLIHFFKKSYQEMIKDEEDNK